MTRAEQKQRAREQDAQDLASGKVTREELRRKNSFLPLHGKRRGRVNYRGAKAVV